MSQVGDYASKFLQLPPYFCRIRKACANAHQIQAMPPGRASCFLGRQSHPSFQHPPGQRAAVQMFPKTFTRQLIDANRLCSRRINTKAIAIQHLETLCFPAFPVFDLAPKTDRYVRHAKIQIRQAGQLFAVAVALLNHHSPPTTGFLRDRIDLQEIDERHCGIGECLGDESLCQTCPIIPSWHFSLPIRLHCSLWPYCALAGASHFRQFLIWVT